MVTDKCYKSVRNGSHRSDSVGVKIFMHLEWSAGVGGFWIDRRLEGVRFLIHTGRKGGLIQAAFCCCHTPKIFCLVSFKSHFLID